jgi:hypothetical protein
MGVKPAPVRSAIPENLTRRALAGHTQQSGNLKLSATPFPLLLYFTLFWSDLVFGMDRRSSALPELQLPSPAATTLQVRVVSANTQGRLAMQVVSLISNPEAPAGTWW